MSRVQFSWARTAVFLFLGVGLCGAVGGSVKDARAELLERRREERRLQAQIEAMRSLLAEPSAALRRARVSLDELEMGERLGAGFSASAPTLRTAAGAPGRGSSCGRSDGGLPRPKRSSRKRSIPNLLRPIVVASSHAR